jgi:glycosyltransferase involved in cell wall biosynthesis
MMRIKKITSWLGTIYYLMKGVFNPSHISSAYDIPIIINNFNRLTTLKLLIDALVERGYNNIHIIDNASTYAPLLKYYETLPFAIHFLKENLGYKALWKSGLSKTLCRDFYVYTDSDVVPVEECPKEFIEFFLSQLRKHPFARKIGFSLKIDDIPDCYNLKKKVLEFESKYYSNPTADGKLVRAPIDTTFALYRPFVGLSRSRSVEAYRTAFPYQARHLPWYNDSTNLSEEEIYYIKSCRKVTEWTSQTKL